MKSVKGCTVLNRKKNGDITEDSNMFPAADQQLTQTEKSEHNTRRNIIEIYLELLCTNKRMDVERLNRKYLTEVGKVL
jgi:hypothetical protein